ncbi:MAG: hypothetical protein KDE56_32545, partial [Anaerolineales bacterium]|nr:hypothetical protein [Anaerolineales bacterium]
MVSIAMGDSFWGLLKKIEASIQNVKVSIAMGDSFWGLLGPALMPNLYAKVSIAMGDSFWGLLWRSGKRSVGIECKSRWSIH